MQEPPTSHFDPRTVRGAANLRAFANTLALVAAASFIVGCVLFTAVYALRALVLAVL